MLVSFLAKYGDTAAKYLWERDVLEHKEPKRSRKICFEMCLKLLHPSHFTVFFTKSNFAILPEFHELG